MPSESEPTAPPPPTAPGPTVFISYASEDRPAARLLRDTLAAGGIDVWYDENELTGGDAWDQKLRRQIRDCEYFMPVISATTEARKEGYFRREWRLATERTLDMADDVLFLLPVVLDDTSESTARVPDKFLTVQWLRAPGGHATPALHHLLRRLVARETHIAVRPAGATRAPFQRTQAPFGAPPPVAPEPPPLAPPPANTPPPLPPMPHAPDRAGFLHGLRFLFEVLRWALHVAWMIFLRAPRWVRVVVTIWVVLTLLPLKCGRDSSKNPATAARPAPAETETPAEAAVKTAAREARKSGNAADLARIGNELARNFGVNVDGPGPGKKTVLLVPFAKLDSDEPADKFASAVFASLYGHLSLAHPRDVGLARPPPGGGPVDPARAGRGKAGGAGFVLSGEVTGEGEARALVVRLVAVAGGDVKWTATYPVALTDPTAVADQIATHIVAVIPRREPAKSK